MIGEALALGFFLGMRHATDADHVLAVSTIVSRKRALRAALPIGVLWGLGHTLTLLLVGGAIISFRLVIPPRLGLSLELGVALMLVTLGALNLWGVLARPAKPHAPASQQAGSLRPLFVGIVHGLAGSAATALLVLGAIESATWALCYLVVFALGTIAGMALVTLLMALPLAASARHFQRLHSGFALGAGVASVIFGGVLLYQIGFVHGLFGMHPQWTPE